MFIYLSDLAPHVNCDTYKAIFRTYIQSSLNYYYIAAVYLGGDSLVEFCKYEEKLRSIRNVMDLPLTTDICKRQLTTLNQTYPPF